MPAPLNPNQFAEFMTPEKLSKDAFFRANLAGGYNHPHKTYDSHTAFPHTNEEWAAHLENHGGNSAN